MSEKDYSILRIKNDSNTVLIFFQMYNRTIIRIKF